MTEDILIDLEVKWKVKRVSNVLRDTLASTLKILTVSPSLICFWLLRHNAGESSDGLARFSGLQRFSEIIQDT